MMCPEVDTKQHKKARFFMKTSYFFGENNLKSFFRPGWKGMGDPGVEEVETVSVSAMLPLLFKQEYLALSSKKDESRNSFSPYSRSLQGTFA